jgi:hypothetical protein
MAARHFILISLCNGAHEKSGRADAAMTRIALHHGSIKENGQQWHSGLRPTCNALRVLHPTDRRLFARVTLE